MPFNIRVQFVKVECLVKKRVWIFRTRFLISFNFKIVH